MITSQIASRFAYVVLFAYALRAELPQGVRETVVYLPTDVVARGERGAIQAEIRRLIAWGVDTDPVNVIMYSYVLDQDVTRDQLDGMRAAAMAEHDARRGVRS